MHSNDREPDAPAAEAPSMLDLVRLSPRRLFPPGGVELYRQIALLTEMSPGDEVLCVACGKGVSLAYFAEEHEVAASGIDVDPDMVAAAESFSRSSGLGDRMQLQTGRSDSLPYRDEIFDVAVGEIGLANHCDPEDAVRELVRVVKPGGFVVLVQLVWRAPVDPTRRRVLSEHLGAKPLMVVEWKRLLKVAGVDQLHTENWTGDETSFRQPDVKPFPDFAELFSLPERLGILRRAWGRWGIRGVSTLLARETEVHQLLTNDRILGLDLLLGRKAAAGGEAPARPAARAGPQATSGSPQVAEAAGDASGQGAADRAPERRDATGGRPRADARGPGARPADAAASADDGRRVPASVAALPHPADAGEEETAESGGSPASSDAAAQTQGLPLFGDETDDTGEGSDR